MSRLAFEVTYWGLQMFWVFGAIAAYSTNMLTVGQMRSHGIYKGMPYLWHLGMTNDAVTFHPFLALLVGLYWWEWLGSSWWLLAAVLFGIATGWYANWGWTRGTDIIEAHRQIHVAKIRSTGEMSIVGMVHIPHMAVMMAIIFLFVVWVAKGEVPWKLAVASACLIAAHICVGQHWLLRLLNPIWNPWPQMDSAMTFGILNAAFFATGFYFLISFFLDYAD